MAKACPLNISSPAVPELHRAQSIAAEVVRSHCERIGADPELAALILVSGLEGPITQLVMTAPEALMSPQLVVHLQAAALSYLSALATGEKSLDAERDSYPGPSQIKGLATTSR